MEKTAKRGRPNRVEPTTLIQVGFPESEAEGLRQFARESGYATVQALIRERMRRLLREDQQL
jgi:hypothetical protein